MLRRLLQLHHAAAASLESDPATLPIPILANLLKTPLAVRADLGPVVFLPVNLVTVKPGAAGLEVEDGKIPYALDQALDPGSFGSFLTVTKGGTERTTAGSRAAAARALTAFSVS